MRGVFESILTGASVTWCPLKVPAGLSLRRNSSSGFLFLLRSLSRFHLLPKSHDSLFPYYGFRAFTNPVFLHGDNGDNGDSSRNLLIPLKFHCPRSSHIAVPVECTGTGNCIERGQQNCCIYNRLQTLSPLSPLTPFIFTRFVIYLRMSSRMT